MDFESGGNGLSVDDPGHRFGRERGASALLVALSMLMLLGFAALAVDIGAGFNERRQDQNAADAAVLGGALEVLLLRYHPTCLV